MSSFLAFVACLLFAVAVASPYAGIVSNRRPAVRTLQASCPIQGAMRGEHMTCQSDQCCCSVEQQSFHSCYSEAQCTSMNGRCIVYKSACESATNISTTCCGAPMLTNRTSLPASCGSQDAYDSAGYLRCGSQCALDLKAALAPLGSKAPAEANCWRAQREQLVVNSFCDLVNGSYCITMIGNMSRMVSMAMSGGAGPPAPAITSKELSQICPCARTYAAQAPASHQAGLSNLCLKLGTQYCATAVPTLATLRSTVRNGFNYLSTIDTYGVCAGADYLFNMKKTECASSCTSNCADVWHNYLTAVRACVENNQPAYNYTQDVLDEQVTTCLSQCPSYNSTSCNATSFVNPLNRICNATANRCRTNALRPLLTNYRNNYPPSPQSSSLSALVGSVVTNVRESGCSQAANGSLCIALLGAYAASSNFVSDARAFEQACVPYVEQILNSTASACPSACTTVLHNFQTRLGCCLYPVITGFLKSIAPSIPSRLSSLFRTLGGTCWVSDWKKFCTNSTTSFQQTVTFVGVKCDSLASSNTIQDDFFFALFEQVASATGSESRYWDATLGACTNGVNMTVNLTYVGVSDTDVAAVKTAFAEAKSAGTLLLSAAALTLPSVALSTAAVTVTMPSGSAASPGTTSPGPPGAPGSSGASTPGSPESLADLNVTLSGSTLACSVSELLASLMVAAVLLGS